ncbi:hypothetical protein [Brevundimonas variabilis]|uniref:Uncharacterized protein n=1 Tax=Brevundimonas variabilis TaxID=74312 RepID=A0A7W9FE92_9CAUL|nr:hypothetical protein [Brevundimonas variabilis]MBB5746035.1 hypothetical protein [Brevundimonas variabilis]
MSDRAFRSLESLEKSASTARVLNLLQVARDYRLTPDWVDRPLFRTPELNACLLLKHRLRRNEYDIFRVPRQVATKIVVPIDRWDLKTGGRYVFVGQINYERTMAQVFGVTADHPDFIVLGMIDRLPSLDPFLLRERLSRAGLNPAPCYFQISDADLQDMLDFVKLEISPLVHLSLRRSSVGPRSIEGLALKILSNAPGDESDALRSALNLRADQYQECVFCWRGLLYYKWVMVSVLKRVAGVLDSIRLIKPIGPLDMISREYIVRSRKVLRTQIARTCLDVQNTLQIYDLAYADLTKQGNPAEFKGFLLAAPSLFMRLGEQLGAIQHIVSFSSYRFGAKAAPPGSEELMDILMDFEVSLRIRDVDAV